jgi:hypothetical protein
MMPGIPVQSPVDNRGFHMIRKLRCQLGLQMAEFGTYPLGQQFRYWRGNESFTTMTATIKNVERAQRASQTPYRNGGTDNSLSGADDDSGDTVAQLRNTAAIVR